MHPSLRNLIVAGPAGVSLVSAATVFAGGPGMMGYGPSGGGPHHAAVAPDDMAARQPDALAKSLKRQPGQGPAWASFATVAEAQAKRTGALRDAMGNGKGATAPERIDLANTLTREPERPFAEAGKAMKGLYDVLSPEQRKPLDRRGPWVHG